MLRLGCTVLIAMLVTAWGGDAPQQSGRSESQVADKNEALKTNACALLTAEEIEAAAGWKPDTADPDTYGSTTTCSYEGPQPMTQTVVLVLTSPVPKVASSAAMAEWRNKQAQRHPDMKMIIKPVEGLGVPAITNELEGSGKPSLEVAANGMLLGITTSSVEVAKTLATKAVARLE